MIFQIDNNARDALLDLQRQFPKEFRAGLMTLGTSLRSRMQKEVAKGQVPGQSWPALHALTMALRNRGMDPRIAMMLRKRRGWRGRTFGGKLPGLLRYKVMAGGLDVRVGWMDDMTPGVTRTATLFQGAESRPFTRREHMLMRVLHVNQERTKRRPSRDVINAEGTAQVTSDDAIRIVAGRIRSIIEKRARR